MIQTNNLDSTNCIHPLCLPETLSRVFYHFEPLDNIRTMRLVCTVWNDWSTDVAKRQLLFKAKEDLNTKMLPFLTMTGGKFEDYCPAWNEICISKEGLSLEKIHALINGLTEKHTGTLESACMFNAASIDRDIEMADLQLQIFSHEDPETEALGKKLTLAMKNHIVERREDICKNTYISIMNCNSLTTMKFEGILLFPLELFNLKTEVENNQKKLIGDRKGNYCFPLRNKLIEVVLVDFFENPDKEVHHMDIDINKTPVTSFYIPKLDADNSHSLESFNSDVALFQQKFQ